MGWDEDMAAAKAALRPVRGALAASAAPVHAMGAALAPGLEALMRPGNEKTGGAGRHAARLGVTRGMAGIDCPHRTAWCGDPETGSCYAAKMAAQASWVGFAGAHAVGPAYSWLAHHAPASLADRLIRDVKAAGYDVVRIHDAGDFVSPAHVWAYHAAASATPGTVWFGFTRAWRDASPEWREALAALAALPNVRLRASGDPEASPTAEDAAPFWGRAIVRGKLPRRKGQRMEHAPAPAGAFTCLEQVGKAATCADCGACWRTRAAVAFLEH